MSEPRRQSRRRWWILLLVALVAIPMAWQFVENSNRPMFHNYYGRNDRMIFSKWVFTPPKIDQIGNFAQYDEKLNLFVVVFTHESDGYNRFGLWGGPSQGTLTVASPTGRETIDTIKRTENRLIVFDLKSRTRFESDLQPGDAMKMLMKVDPRDNEVGTIDDIAQVLKEELKLHRYPQGATPMEPWE